MSTNNLTPQERGDPVSNGDLQLELRNVRSEVRLWIVIAIVANQTFAHVELPAAVGFTGAIGVIAWAALKSFALRA